MSEKLKMMLKFLKITMILSQSQLKAITPYYNAKTCFIKKYRI